MAGVNVNNIEIDVKKKIKKDSVNMRYNNNSSMRWLYNLFKYRKTFDAIDCYTKCTHTIQVVPILVPSTDTINIVIF
jgi:hypothetical protein